MSKIEWTDKAWQVLAGCTPVSEACDYCWAARMAATRLKYHSLYDGLAYTDLDGVQKWNGLVRTNPSALDVPFYWRKPRKIFVAPMGDLFHHDVPLEYVAKVYSVMEQTNRHAYQVLTKRPHNALAVYRHLFSSGRVVPQNVWFGFTAETQQRFDERWQYAKEVPASVHFVSIEPMLAPLVLPDDFLALGKRAWVITGGETGKFARPGHPQWFVDVILQCRRAGVPIFHKQSGEWQERSYAYSKGNEKVVSLWEDGRVDDGANIDVITNERRGETTMIRVGKKSAGDFVRFVMPTPKEFPDG